MPAIASEIWTCPTCRRTIETPYCPSCGERSRSPRELTLRGLLAQAFEAITSIDSKLVRSFRDLVTKPGVLTVAFVEGRRKPYLGPMSLFLVSNVVFFAVESLTHGLVLSTTLQSHLHDQPWSDLVRPFVADHIALRQTTIAAYAPQFDAAVALHARSLISLMVIAFVPLPALLLRHRRRPFAVHAVFSLHLYAFILLLLSAGNLVPAAGLPFGYERSASVSLDQMLTFAFLGACGVYLYRAIERTYGGGPWARGLAAFVLTCGVAAIGLGYRFTLLVITVLTTT